MLLLMRFKVIFPVNISLKDNEDQICSLAEKRNSKIYIK